MRTEGQIYGQTDIKKPIVGFRKFANEGKKKGVRRVCTNGVRSPIKLNTYIRPTFVKILLVSF
jgi:hypothetical protein